MGIRETVNQNPAITTGATVAIIVIALTFIVWSALSGGKGQDAPPGSIYYSVDDGKSFIIESGEKRYQTFTVGGVEAVIAHVYSCDKGKTRFVGWLERYTPEAKAELQASANNPRGAGGLAVNTATLNEGREVKKPGAAEWINTTDPKAAEVFLVQCPDGKREAAELLPGD